MRFLFIMDPYASMLPDKDTSFAFMRAAQKRGHQNLHCEPHEISNSLSEVFARARPVTVSDVSPYSVAGKTERVTLSQLDAVFVRKDPPFNAAYQHLTQQLDLVKDRTLVINDPGALRDANEKLFAFHFAQFMPPTHVSASPAEILEFVRNVGGKAVLKPLDGAGGSGVVVLDLQDRNRRALVDLVTREGRELAMVQQFQSDVYQGDKRVLLLGGALLGAIRRVPRDDDFRANIHVGGRVEATDLTPEEQRLVAAVGPALTNVGLHFVGLDLIGEKLIEVNVTSPTGIQELGRLTDTEPELRVVEWVEQKV